MYVEAKWEAAIGTGKGATEGALDDQIVKIAREHFERAVRKTDAFTQIFIRAPIEMLELKLNAMRCQHLRQCQAVPIR